MFAIYVAEFRPEIKAEIGYRIPGNLGVTVLFVAGVKQRSGELRSSVVAKVQAPSPADRPSQRDGQRHIGKTPVWPYCSLAP